MQKIQKRCAGWFEQYFTGRTAMLLLTFFVMAFCFNVHTRWAKTLFHFFLLPVQIGMSYVYIRDKAIHMGGVFKLVCVSLLWLLMSVMLNSFWSANGMVGMWFLLGCWIFALFVPKKTSLQDIHKEIFSIGLVYILFFLPFTLIALSTVFTGKVIYVPWDHTPLGIQAANSFTSRLRIMMNPNKIGIILVFNIFFGIYGFLTRRKKIWKVFFAFVILVNYITSAHVMSRTCIMGLSAAMGMFAFRGVYQLLHNKKFLRIAAGVVACVLMFFLVLTSMDLIFTADVSLARKLHGRASKQIQSRLDDGGAFNADNTGRGEIWEAVFALFKDEPAGLAIGYGAEDVMQMAEDASGIEGTAGMAHVHSAYLDCIARGGVPYLLMVLAFLILLVKPAWQIGMEKSTPETKGLFVIPMFVVALLVMGVSEVMLFVDKSHTNYLFMVMCGYLLHCNNLRKEGKLQA